MTDMNTPIADRVSQMSQPAQMYYNQILKQADENIFLAIKDLRKSQADDSIEPQYRDAANLALVAMTAHLNGDSLPRPKTDAEALQDMQSRIAEAAAAGDRETYDALRAGLAHVAEKAIKADALQEERLAALESNRQAFAEEQAGRYETMLASTKDMEIQKARRMGMDSKEAEAFYAEWSEKTTELAVQRATGYTPPRAPIEE